jgi:hypothetical protein
VIGSKHRHAGHEEGNAGDDRQHGADHPDTHEQHASDDTDAGRHASTPDGPSRQHRREECNQQIHSLRHRRLYG